MSVTNRRLLQTVDVSPFLNLPQNVLAQQQQKLVQTTVPVDFYPSHTVLDDLSWAGVALFLATGQERYLGDAQVRRKVVVRFVLSFLVIFETSKIESAEIKHVGRPFTDCS